MSFARVHAAQPGYPQAHPVAIECDLAQGLYSFAVVGLPDKAVEEARDRVSAAIKYAGYDSPKSHSRKVVISLAPGDLRKEGPLFDLPIALAYLLAAEEVSFDPAHRLFVGELALDGSVRSVHGVLSIALAAREAGFRECYVPSDNAREAALVAGITVYPVDSLTTLVAHLTHPDAEQVDALPGETTECGRTRITPQPPTELPTQLHTPPVDVADVRGQELAKRGLAIAAAGRHNIVLHGPPGTGKTLLARAFAGILPPLSFEEALEATMVHSLASSLQGTLVGAPPFRCPHHSASHVSLVGGGATPRPGEVTLAHRGVLFLDEFPEFDKRSLEALRQPLEDRVVTVSRAKGTVTYPASFILVAAMNPTPHGGTEEPGLIDQRVRERYQKKISGPIMDRIDMWIEVAHVPHDELSAVRSPEACGPTSAKLRETVTRARAIQHERYGEAGKCTSDLSVRELETHVPLTPACTTLLNDAAKKLALSPRAYHRTIKLARTIADLEAADAVAEHHLLEALQYRPRSVFG
ncbi:YifB family Mg chelatase-like AAA ATPase [Patescibacteria group bacterium]|jgi:magnesium chelatase family protein|nr:YifB family Mg chelatase-like AAA ATPase [Patescibacteria group bacterium]